MGAAAWLALQTVPARMARLRLLLMLITALGVFWEAGYLLYSMMRSDGDWFFAARAAFGEPAWPWQIGGAVTGLVLYLVGMRATAAATRALVGADESSGRRRARALLRTAWIAASVSACVAAAAYAPDRLGAMRQASLEIGAGSLPLLMLARRIRPGSARMEMPLSRHFGWIVFAVVLYAVFVATLGRGI
jgi:hypothetical protein